MTPIIILDEAQYLKHATLNDLKIIFNFDMDSKDKAVVILCGLPQLNNTLSLNTHELLRQRIVMNNQIQAMNKEESLHYIQDKLKGAGSYQEVFEPHALKAIITAAGGIPRMINKICNTYLLFGNNNDENIITRKIVMMAVNDIQLM